MNHFRPTKRGLCQ